MTKNKTTSLHMIVKDEVTAVAKLVGEASHYFDDIYLTISDKKAYEGLKALPVDNIHVDYRKWNDRFDDARNHNWDLGKKHDYSMWLDADDSFDFSQMPKLISYMEDYDAVYLPYHYAFDDNGNVIVSHQRERLVKRSIGWVWKGWVHETLIPEKPFNKFLANVPVIHNSDHRDESMGRNHDILMKAYEATKDPRYIHYLAISFFTQKKYDEAIELFKEYISVGGWDEEIYRSLVKLSECYYNKNNYDEAGRFALEAIGYMPELPMAYYCLAQYEFKQENWKQALEWVKVAIQKPEPENTSIYDPTSANRALLTGALCEYELGNYREALQLLKKVYVVDTSEILPDFEYQASVDRLREILPALFKHYKNPAFLWSNLDDSIKYDNRFRAYREQFTQPETWSDGTVVFFCGKGYEEWGAHTLDKGMGGSEEAIVYLSRELAKLGKRVTVFGEVPKAYDDYVAKNKFVAWRPWKHIDKRDTFDTLVIWRAPQFADQFKAKKILIDMHDKLPVKVVRPLDNAIYMFKSQYHKNLYPEVTKSEVVPNGVLVEQFDKEYKKKKYSVGYFSAYYRGLEVLLALWPKIKEQVPQATLDIYYGWGSWVSVEGEDDFYHRMCKKFEALKDHGVTEHGRISHEELAKVMSQTKVWAYPTEFTEIFGITAVKANAAHCTPVITDVAALKETGGPVSKVIETDLIYSDEYSRKKFVDAVVKALKSDITDDDKNRQDKFVKQFAWSTVAKKWIGVIDES